MPDGLNWDEFRIVKAVAETQSLAAAGARLGVNHTTIFRRLGAVERRLGAKLFERERGGYRPTLAGRDMVSLAILMSDTIAEFERRVAGTELELSGTLRLTALSSLGVMVLPPVVARLLKQHPRVHVELQLTETTLDLLRGESDMALRGFRGVPQDGLTGQRIARLSWAAYASPRWRDARGRVDISEIPWVLPLERAGPPQARRWIERNVEAGRRVAAVDGIVALAEMAAQGVGAVLLPTYLGASRPDLVRIGDADPDLDRDVWLVAHPQTLRTGRLRALFDFICTELKLLRAVIEGEAAQVATAESYE